jgi:D-alanyl-lipoteichoic acid acyltransferase DltB (MBOAT superfamily)
MYRYPAWKKYFLAVSILGNIGSLAAFKYSVFLAENLSSLFFWAGISVNLSAHVPEFMLILPVGISFYTFQSMSYTLDIYRGEIKPTKSILHFFAYLSMFPQLVAGPIIRAKDMLPQLLVKHRSTEEERFTGLNLVVQGFFKKMVIADNLAPAVNLAFSATELSVSSMYWWLVITAFSFQIYCDFSGYSDIARGLARWMGYDFAVNFRNPYIATSLKEFWSRWHISLSTWFRDYLYIPLGGNHSGAVRTYCNIGITMLVSGLWHGAAWTFVIWGGLHAFFTCVERFTKWPRLVNKLPFGRLVSSILLLTQVWVAWVFFRAESLTQALNILKIMFSFSDGSSVSLGWDADFFLCIAVLIELGIYFQLGAFFKSRLNFHRRFEPVLLSILIMVCVFFRGPGSEFIYFQF